MPSNRQRPWFWVDNFRGLHYHLTWQERRSRVLSRVESAGFGWWIVFVAGVGFFTDAYDIFAVNTIIPMLSTVYWRGNIPSRYTFGINIATLIGSMIGQVAFGILADMYGRRKMYGLELIVTITATLGFATVSPGVFSSMSVLGLLIFWRIIMGIGIGSDYPLSAVITSEFSPTRYRGAMVAAVFFCQPLGQLVAALMAFAATAGLKSHIVGVSDFEKCAIDAILPAHIDCARTVDRAWRLVAGLGAVPAIVAMLFRLTIPESVYYLLDIQNDTNEAMNAREFFSPSQERIEVEYELEDQTPETIQDGDGDQDYDHDLAIGPPAQNLAPNDLLPPPAHNLRDSILAESLAGNVNVFENPHQIKASRNEFFEYLSTNGNWKDLASTSLNWMLLDFSFYLLGVNSSRFVPRMFGSKMDSANKPYAILIDRERQIMLATSIGAVLGGAIAIKVMNNFSRKKVQMWAFITLGGLFVTVGVMYITLVDTNKRVAIIVIYALCQFFFNLGPNTTTFIIPAEAFPTRYRCTCHGISAACGKFGSVLGQILVMHITSKDFAGWILIAFIIIMAAGALLTKFLTPETCDIRGKSRKLEDLAGGRARRKILEEAERREAEREKAENS